MNQSCKQHNKKEIKINIFDSFSCIANRCSMTCCKEWKIAVDDETKQKWASTTLHQVSKKSLANYVVEKDGTSVIELDHHNNCPFLNKENLCELVIHGGEELLSTTCTRFPREVHEFKDRREYSLMASCPEVVDCMNRVNQITFTTSLNEIEQDDMAAIRTLLIHLVEQPQYSIAKALMMGFYIILEFSENEHKISHYQDKALYQQLSKTINQMTFSPLETFDERNELFLDLSEDYRKQGIYTKFLEPIATFTEEIISSYDEDEMLDWLGEFEQEYSKYESLLRKCVVLDLFQTMYTPLAEFEDCMVMFQWITLRYAMIKQWILLNWLQQERAELPYETVRDGIVIIWRMTGYEEEDIVEYLNQSFHSIVWDWGYLALVLGNDQ